ncbi:MAG: ComEC/Rec2-related protein [Candidatus Amesbacteria bacterium GW2011_GWB1_47_19]|nr:MAG: ComEC/Rec2-related protein [Candidatus Amesbacteria bacterium GW2011_GWA1_44_24]KKU31962.1 MAG: ComEC/Rec2-related protein, competence protein ComEC [Candidatus Amesbacteria bacterium GW2011_GWC1_46_24]KKU66898.1 MAG: ComEC/Rec2-related protein [Candidatus Amesbacteria bacterium GW2011_GWB1_47_19]OGD05959.1 MAG: hypothetical protein A2379_02805 [Candidatus Amesbacteria bacterium RIFOXYB1_FULL_47_13]HBC72238.1 hypothetical protein [Candidatus Amesbacteria bacterium]
MVKWLFLTGLVILAGVRVFIADRGRSVVKEGDKIRIRFVLTSEPYSRYGKSYVRYKTGFESGVEIEIPKNAEYADRIVAEGRLEGGKLRDVKSAVVTSTGGWIKRVYDLRIKLSGRIQSWLGGDEGALAAGILMGGSGSFTAEGKENFRKTGLLHVVAASGYNVSVVAGWAMVAGAGWLGRRRVIIFVILSIVLYVIMAGAGAAVIRAGIMGILTWTGLAYGRKSDAGWMLVLAALGMVMVKPEWWWDVGFQLSVTATAGLVWLYPVFDRRRMIRARWLEWLEKDIKVSMAAYIATLPLILHHFGNVSVIAPAINALVLWVVPPVMQLTALAVAIGFFIPTAGQVISWLCWPLVRYMTGVVNMAAGWEWAGWERGSLDWLWVAGYYLVLLLMIRIARPLNRE